MFRRSRRVCGSFLLNQRLVADWWHAGAREEVHQAAKARLEAALEEVSARASAPAPTDGGDAPNAVHHAPPLSLYEANGLVATFVSAHNTPDVSATLQYIREELGEELSPYHFHALLRCFNYHHDVANALQLLEVMAQSGTTTLETYARIADGVHALAPPDAQARLMELVGLAQDAFGTLVMENGVGSEAATIAAYSLSEEGHAAREAAAAVHAAHAQASDAAESTAAVASPSSQSAPPARSAPLLSSLLYHYSATGHRDSPVACVIVALWIRALGVALSEWDLFAVLTSVLAGAEEFPRFCALFSSFDAFERGAVGVEAVVRRLVRLHEVDAPRASSSGARPLLSDAMGDAEEGEEHRSHAASASLLTSLVTTMLASLRAAGVDAATAVVTLPFINAQTNSMSQLVASTLRPLVDTGVGPHGYNAGQLFHAVSLLHSSLGDDTSAIEAFVRAARAQQRCDAAAAQAEAVATGAPSSCPSSLRQASNAAREPFAVSAHHALDVGTLLSNLSTTTLRDLRGPFRAATRRLADASAPRAGASTEPSSSASSPAELAAFVWCTPARASARDVAMLSSFDAPFIETLPEARAMLRRAVDAVGGSGRLQGRTPSHTTQHMFAQLARLCCRHPPRNPKLTPAGLEERLKWGRYLDARDASLALFGSARQSRDAMKHLFYNDNKLPALRSEQVIAKDFTDVHHFFLRFRPPGQSEAPTTLSQAELQAALLRTRTTLPHTGSSGLAVPRYLWDPEVYNPYPAANLPLNTAALVGAEPAFTAAEVHQTGSGLVGDGDGDTDAEGLSGFFVELWRALLDTTGLDSNRNVWYLQNTELYMLLVRCLLHRLDWEAAAHLTRVMTQQASYTYLMDHELTTIFREIGDPAGCLAFKVATKLFDGRITRDGQEKRDKFQQDHMG